MKLVKKLNVLTRFHLNLEFLQIAPEPSEVDVVIKSGTGVGEFILNA